MAASDLWIMGTFVVRLLTIIMAAVKRIQTLVTIMKKVMFTMIVMMAWRVTIIKKATVNESEQNAQYWLQGSMINRSLNFKEF